MKRETYAFLIALAVVAVIIMNTNTAIGNSKIEAAIADAQKVHINKSRHSNGLKAVSSVPAATNAASDNSAQGLATASAAISKNFGENTENIDSNDVLVLQKYLAANGYLKEKYVTGEFGPITKQAVKDFQVANNITPATGFVGDVTREKINSGN